MGTVGAIFLVAALGVGLYAMSARRPMKITMKDRAPNSFDSFQTTTTQEGMIVPWICGTIRLPGNLLWYGGLTTVPITETYKYKVPDSGISGLFGGTKTKKETVVVGHKYYMDLWFGVAEGPNVTISGFFKDGKGVYDPDTGDFTGAPGSYNTGGQDTYPPFSSSIGTYVTKCNPLCHLWMQQAYLGDDVNNVPNYSFVASRSVFSGVSPGSTGYGPCPASLIYEFLLDGGALATDIDITSFNAASTIWAAKSYGMNLRFNQQSNVRDRINYVFTHVDGVLYIDEEDKYILKAYQDSDAADWTVDEADFKTFQFQRQTWDDCYNHFSATFIDGLQEFTERSVQVRNSATKAIMGYERSMSVDLAGFNRQWIAQQRLEEIMKNHSYPKGFIDGTLGPEFEKMKPGDVIDISHTDYGIVSALYRVVDVQGNDISTLEVKFKAEEMLGGTYSGTYAESGTSQWTNPDYTPDPPGHQWVIELPNIGNNTDPTYLALVARQGVETGFQVKISTDGGTNYSYNTTCGTFSMRGTLDEAYAPASTTGPLDDDTGILFTPYDEDPVFESIDRDELFLENRIAVIKSIYSGDLHHEIVTFQNVAYEGANSIRLTGVMRGLFGTRKDENHPIGTEIWLTRLGGNIFSTDAANFYVKLVPGVGVTGSSTLLGALTATWVDDDDITGIGKTYEGVAQKPMPIHFIKATRSGSDVTIRIYPTAQNGTGFATASEDVQGDQFPPDYEATVEYYYSHDTTVRSMTAVEELTVSYASAFNIFARAVRDGVPAPLPDKTAGWAQVAVGATDGDYYGPTNYYMHTNTDLLEIPHGALGWNEAMAYNTIKMDEMLTMDGMIDSNVTATPGHKEVLYWDADAETLESDNWGDALPTTTTTTTTTTTSSTTTTT
jgi:hypothetical protein